MQHNPGSYWCRLLGAVVSEIGDKKTPALVMKFDITHRAGSDGMWVDLPQPEQREVRLFLSEAAWPYTEEKLKAFGFSGDFGKPDFDPEWKNAGCELVCKHETSNGKVYEKWDFPRSAGETAPANPDVVRTLNARWKSQNVASAKPAGAPAPPPPMKRTVVHPAQATAATPAAQVQRPVAPAGTAVDDSEPPF